MRREGQFRGGVEVCQQGEEATSNRVVEAWHWKLAFLAKHGIKVLPPFCLYSVPLCGLLGLEGCPQRGYRLSRILSTRLLLDGFLSY